ncbi:hypothetical protein K4F52_002483 [Lecanicillium sp. MT-2017a]|nr:hypothetical protein K4F52_002483 [Lecanicillium sp. MT-2017a]
MPSRFVSGGTIGTASEGADSSTTSTQPPLVPPAPSSSAAPGSSNNSKNAEWEKAQAQLEAERKQREEARVKAAQGEEPSLYAILQANKEAKQAAFEEANKLKNQFRALDDDEIEFLDEVVQRQRKEEEAKRKEMEEGLKLFRQARKADGGSSDKIDDGAGDGAEEVEDWAVGGRKRKRSAQERGGLVRRKVDKKDEAAKVKEDDKGRGGEAKSDKVEVKKEAPKTALGLVDYGSDSDDEDEDE